MSAPMEFRGGLVFDDVATRDVAARALRRNAQCLVGPDGLTTQHLMLHVELEQVAPSAFWETTVMALSTAGEGAWAGFVDCTYGSPEDSERTEVAASGKRHAGSEACARDGEGWLRAVWRRLKGAKPAGEESPAQTLRQWASSWPQEQKKLCVFPEAAQSYRFEFEDCQVLTYYALTDDRSEPHGDCPSFVVGLDTVPDDAPLMPDRAPYFTLDDVNRVAVSICRTIAIGQRGSSAAVALEELLNWIQGSHAEWFGYQLEPPELAGDGKARALGLEAEERSVDEDDEDRVPPEKPWKKSPKGGYLCPQCGSDRVETRSTTSLGDYYLEAMCHNCDNFGGWSDG